VASEHVDPLIAAHREWIGYVQPTGLLVAPAALAQRGIAPDGNIAELQNQLDLHTQGSVNAELSEAQRAITDFAAFATSFLGWETSDIVGLPGVSFLPDELGSDLVEYGERLLPTYAIPAAEHGATDWQMLIRAEPDDLDFDSLLEDDGRRWAASPHDRFERLLRDTNIPIGLLTNSRSFRLVYAPKGETSGFATFDLAAMLEVSGRPMLSAFHMLLNVNRLFGSPDTSLPALLAESRQYQETVSTKLAEQVLVALNELLRGFYAADVRTRRSLTVDLATRDPEHLYSGLLTALLRLVFVLYAEDRDLFPRNEVWEQNYSLGGLFERLRGDAALFPDTMDDRYGAWAQLLALWRLVYWGGSHADLRLVARRGRMFDPDRFPFIEGRPGAAAPVDIPAISDGVVWRILQGLMMLDGDRLSYRTLDVEQIGSVYQSVMGFSIELTTGPSLAIRPQKSVAASATINLEHLLSQPATKRPEWIQKRTDRKVSTKVAAAVKAAKTITELEAILASVIDLKLTPKVLPEGVPVLQPTEMRRRSGSHYTPRALTAPIVAETLRPILERFGADATAEEILGLRVLDPALGSGAFLVEACRQLGDRVVSAWERHGSTPALPSDEDALLHARRLVAQRCLYGVDRNATAADLAKLSLWLATLAKDHEFTFVDHAIRHGDALVGLSREQLGSLHWAPHGSLQLPFVAQLVRAALKSAEEGRERIRSAEEGSTDAELQILLSQVERNVANVRLIGNALLTAFFANDKPKAREAARGDIVSMLGHEQWPALLSKFANDERTLSPFHWHLEFPEIFERSNAGFDAIVGNPPYAGKNTIIAANPKNYIAWLQTLHEGAHGNADLVAHFFRRAFALLRDGGTLGFIATKTIRQGDTRNTGLCWIRHNGGTIYSATRRYRWPGEAAVIVSVVHLVRGGYHGVVRLDGRAVKQITAYLFDQGGDDDPARLAANANLSFVGSYPLGMGFIFDDTDPKGLASTTDLMEELIAKDPTNRELIKPYVGGDDVLTAPQHRGRRYIIDFGGMSLEEASQWPELLEIVRSKVKPQRDADNRPGRRRYWWRFAERAVGLYAAIAKNARVLVTPRTAARFAFTFLESGSVYEDRLVVVSLDSWAAFAVLQSRLHEIWSLFFGYSLEDRPCYAPSDVFQTFPFPNAWSTSRKLDAIGRVYFERRAQLMITNNEGLTRTYNRFHNSSDKSPPIESLRQLHNELDRAVLDAYGWFDISEDAAFVPEWGDEAESDAMRYGWSMATRDDVLARLLRLNEERMVEEERLGIALAGVAVDEPAVGESERDAAEAL